MALWGGRFTGSVSHTAQLFGASLPVDSELFRQDIAASKAHAEMLAHQGIISNADAAQIVEGLDAIGRDIEAGSFEFDINDEDIHMAVEAELTRRIGEAGKRLHTARSRNDQVATDTHLAAKSLTRSLLEANLELRRALVQIARDHGDAMLPGYTHLQHAQPVLLAHHLLAYYWMFARDFGRIYAAFQAADASPLGAAALAGTSYPIDRQMTARLLGFGSVYPNSLDAVSDRDYLLDLHYACSTAAMHLSRLAEEIILWSSSEFGFVALSDQYSTGSSIMPQKKNPDFAELIRGKSGRVLGNLVQLLTTMKGLPLAYNKDLQEDKEGMLDSAHTLLQAMEVMGGLISTMKVNGDAMRGACEKGFLAATDVADYLAKRGLPFREAHAIVGNLVLVCEQRGCELGDLPLSVYREASELFEPDILRTVDLDAVVNARSSEGGTAPAALAAQFKLVRTSFATDEATLAGIPVQLAIGRQYETFQSES